MTRIIIRNECDDSQDCLYSPIQPGKLWDEVVGLQVLFHEGRGKEYGYGCYGRIGKAKTIEIVFWPLEEWNAESVAEAIHDEPIEL